MHIRDSLAEIQMFENLSFKGGNLPLIKLSFDLFTAGNLQNIFMEHDLLMNLIS